MNDAQEPVEFDSLKRKRSLSIEFQRHIYPAAKAPRTSQAPERINYLARHVEDDLALISPDDALPSIVHLLREYDDVLDRQESLAYNLGARPLGPMLMKRVERIFDGIPRIFDSHGGGAGQPLRISWLEVIEYAQANPDHFNLSQTNDGLRVCEFYTKQCRIQISEEDYNLIRSGMPQKMIPPQPMAEDEEKELGTLEIIERSIQQIASLADQGTIHGREFQRTDNADGNPVVAARARQLNHRLKGRKQAIVDRGVLASVTMDGTTPPRASSPSLASQPNGAQIQSPRSPSGFVAVNSRPAMVEHTEQPLNGQAISVPVSQGVREDLLRTFRTISERRASLIGVKGVSNANIRLQSPAAASPGRPYPVPPITRPSIGPRSAIHEDQNLATSLLSYNPDNAILAPIQSSSPQGRSRASVAEKDDGGPFRVEIVARLESIPKGERISPPCDRCRRLHMDCRRNLTACVGCTKKHAKCSWREVKEDELRNIRHSFPGSYTHGEAAAAHRQDLVGERVPIAPELHEDNRQQHRRRQYLDDDEEHVFLKQQQTHDEEMQAARSLAMAAVADAATQAQMDMQRETSATAECANGMTAANIPTHSPFESSERLSSNLDPSLQSAEVRYAAVRNGG